MAERITAFPPVAPPGARVLILGSMPSVESLNQGFYYAHPRNAFWRILADVYGEPLPVDIPGKVALLTRHDIALWDVLQSCERQGSLDSAIRQPTPNVPALLRYPADTFQRRHGRAPVHEVGQALHRRTGLP